MFEWLFGRRVYHNEISVIDGDSIHWRKGGWGSDGQQSEGEIPYRLEGLDAPALSGRAECKSEREARWGEAAKVFLDQQLKAAKI
jgi:endonuclease YncB( thermonuclease family)